MTATPPSKPPGSKPTASQPPTAEDELKRQLDELDDRIEVLVASLDEDAPETHAVVYAEIERIHAQIAALKARARQSGQALH